MCICVRLQDPDEKPTKADPKYFEKARVALLKKVESGQVVTRRMLQQEVQKFYRQDYKAWHNGELRRRRRGPAQAAGPC